jgi:DNA-binding PadR family transcriptional regulator
MTHFEDDRFDRAHDRVHRAQHRMWHKFEAMGRRGFGGPGWGGPGGPGGPGGRGGWGDWGDSFRIGRMMASGDLRLIALYFIEQQPRHGYDLIKAIEERTGGIYVPSPGVVYPALTFLEEAGYVTSSADGNKRLYTITDEGKAHLSDNRAAVETTLAHLSRIGEQFAKVKTHWEEAERNFREPPPRPDRDMEDVEPEVNEARKALKQAIKEAARNRDPHNQRRLADILRRAAEEIQRGSGGERRVDIEIDI